MNLITAVSISPVGTSNPVVLSNTSVAGKQSPGQMFCIFFLTTRSISIQIFIWKNLYILLSKEVQYYVLLQYFIEQELAKNFVWAVSCSLSISICRNSECHHAFPPASLPPSVVTDRSLALKCFLFKCKKDGRGNLSCAVFEICTTRVLRAKADNIKSLVLNHSRRNIFTFSALKRNNKIL